MSCWSLKSSRRPEVLKMTMHFYIDVGLGNMVVGFFVCWSTQYVREHVVC